MNNHCKINNNNNNNNLKVNYNNGKTRSTVVSLIDAGSHNMKAVQEISQREVFQSLDFVFGKKKHDGREWP